MNKADIQNLPIFPNYEENLEDNLLTLSSTVYIHLETDETVEVYRQPVIEAYTRNGNENKQKTINRFLIHCLRISKYIIVSEESVQGLPLVEVLQKSDKYFLDKIHYKYP